MKIIIILSYLALFDLFASDKIQITDAQFNKLIHDDIDQINKTNKKALGTPFSSCHDTNTTFVKTEICVNWEKNYLIIKRNNVVTEQRQLYLEIKPPVENLHIDNKI